MPNILSRFRRSLTPMPAVDPDAAMKALTIQGFGINQNYYPADLEPRFHSYGSGAVSDAGDLWLNSAVAACCNWIARAIPEAPIVVRKRGRKGAQKVVEGHVLAELLRRPNRYFSGDLLLKAVVVSLVCHGNAYLHVVRNLTGGVAELWWIPNDRIKPVAGGDMISHYEVTVNGKRTDVAEADIIHLRDGIDPHNLLLGLSPLAACVREVCSDNQANQYTAAILSNMGVPGVVISPADSSTVMEPEEAEVIKAKWREKVTGSNRGEPLVLPTPLTLEAFGHSPEQMALDKIRDVPESRITACIGIPAMVVGLSSGAATKTYANYEEARRAAWADCLVPLLRLIAGQLDVQLLPLMGDASATEVWFDTSEVTALQDDLNEAAVRMSTLYDSGICKLGEARAPFGFDPTPDDDKFKTEIAAAQNPQADAPAPPIPTFREQSSRIP